MELSVAEKRLKRQARVQAFIVGFLIALALVNGVVVGILASSVLNQQKRVEAQTLTNCYNIEIQRLYHETIVSILGRSDSPITRQIVAASQTAADAMITTDCQEAQG